MTEVQERILLLMDEIKDICVKENLRYVLGKKTAVAAFKYGKFVDNGLSTTLFMPLSDIYKLKEYVDKNYADSRIIECWDNNAELKQMEFRYVDKGTLLYDGQSVERIKYPGIAVLILPIREKEVSNRVKSCERYILSVNKYNNPRLFEIISNDICYKVSGLPLISKLFHSKSKNRPKGKGLGYGVFKSFTMSNEKITKFVKNKLVLKNGEKPSYYWYLSSKDDVYECPMDLFDNTVEIELEGHKYLIYAKAEEYFNSFYGEKLDLPDSGDINKDGIVDLSDRITLIVECDLPYEEYLDYIKDKGPSLNEIAYNKKKYNVFMVKYFNPMQRKYMRKYYRIKCCVDRIDVWSRLKPKREALKAAYEKKDIPEIKKLLKEYLSKTDYYINKGVGFYIDDEIFTYAKLVWKKEKPSYKVGEDKNISYAKKVYKKVPKLHKTETVDQYFQSRNNS